MKIVQINTFPHKATGVIMMNLHRMLTREGYESYVVWGRGREPQETHEIKIKDEIGVSLHGIYTRITDKTGFASKRATRKLLTELDRIRPDIIHLHNIHGYYLNIEMLFEYINRHCIKVVWTLHDCWPFTGHCAYFDMAGCDKWKTGCRDCPQKDSYPASKLFDHSEWNWKRKRELFQKADIRLVTPSNWLKEMVSQSFLHDFETDTIYNGLDLTIFRPDKTVKKENIVLGVASEWTKRKGLDDFIKLSRILDKSYQFLLIGLTKQQMKRLPDHIKGLGRTKNVKELVSYYNRAKVFLNLSYEETMGMTTVEALACGTPVIVYNATALPEIVTEKVGVIIEKGAVTSIPAAIKKLEEDAGVTADACRKHAERFRVELQNAAYLKLYQEIFSKL